MQLRVRLRRARGGLLTTCGPSQISGGFQQRGACVRAAGDLFVGDDDPNHVVDGGQALELGAEGGLALDEEELC